MESWTLLPSTRVMLPELAGGLLLQVDSWATSSVCSVKPSTRWMKCMCTLRRLRSHYSDTSQACCFVMTWAAQFTFERQHRSPHIARLCATTNGTEDLTGRKTTGSYQGVGCFAGAHPRSMPQYNGGFLVQKLQRCPVLAGLLDFAVCSF